MANPLAPSNPSSPIVVASVQGAFQANGLLPCGWQPIHTLLLDLDLVHALGDPVDRNTDAAHADSGNDAEYTSMVTGMARPSAQRAPSARIPGRSRRRQLVVRVPSPAWGFETMLAGPELIIVDSGPAEASRLPISADLLGEKFPNHEDSIFSAAGHRSGNETFPRGQMTLFLRTQVFLRYSHRGNHPSAQANKLLPDANRSLMNTRSVPAPDSAAVSGIGTDRAGVPDSEAMTGRMDAFCNELLGIVATNATGATHVRRARSAPLNATCKSQPRSSSP